jgi:glycosyltransferase involved in cell wall biosynthesis
MASRVAEAASRLPGLTWLGQRQRSEVQRLMAEAACLIFPSVTYETFGQVIVEAYAAGTPVIASAGGVAPELVEHERTGLLARSGDADDLVAQVEWLLAHPRSHEAMRTTARAAFEARFTADANYRSLVAIYSDAIANAAARSQAGIRRAVRAIPPQEVAS